MDDELEFAKSRIGQHLSNKYELEGLIGLGGMAVVYRGRHRKNGNRVAIKMLHPVFSRHQEVSARFLKEGYVANSVDHAGTVRVLDDDVAEDGSVYLVMDLLEGETIEARRRRLGGTLSVAEVTYFAHEILEVLGAAHEKGIVHRDIKPENLFVMTAGTVRVLDFGIARARTAGLSATRSGVLMGTPGYLPPEQAQGLTREIDGRTDLWALGAVMFTLLTGDYVHVAETPQQMIIYTATRPARSLREAAPELPDELIALVDRALAFDKNDRFEDAAAMQEALREVPGYAGASSVSPLGPTSLRRTARAPAVDAVTSVELALPTLAEPASDAEPAPESVRPSSNPVTSTLGEWPPPSHPPPRPSSMSAPANPSEAPPPGPWFEAVSMAPSSPRDPEPSARVAEPPAAPSEELETVDRETADPGDELQVPARQPVGLFVALALVALALVAFLAWPRSEAPAPKPAAPPRAPGLVTPPQDIPPPEPAVDTPAPPAPKPFTSAGAVAPPKPSAGKR
ncbi:MAG: protein kinase [Myxococcales bacterium]|nr:protein kinase [Myxococcales bacterium]MBL0195783.1 protein kinase [Myxococcales bacterium]HQY63557.1 protein kinase [Polyangiaceae bacterium]